MNLPNPSPEVNDAFTHGWKSRDLRPLEDWAPDNIEVGSWSPWPGKMSFAHTPWLIEPMRALRRETCHRVTIVAAAAGGKSTVAETFLAWLIGNAPGFACWYCHTDDLAKEFAETRIWPFLSHVPQVVHLLPDNRHKRRTQSILFPHMSLLILPANKSSTQSKHIRYLICDETWLWEPGMLMQAHKRTTQFSHNRKILELSTGSVLGDETDQAFNAGTRREWQFTCPKCGKLHVPFWSPERPDMPGGVRWAKECRLENGIWDFNRVRATVYYECPHCREQFRPSAENQWRLNGPDSYTQGTPEAAHESFHWSAWVSSFQLLGDFAVEFLQAKAAIKRGSIELLQEFTQKREASAWDASLADAVPITLEASTYDIGDVWEVEHRRFGSVDVQKDGFWFLARDWAPGPQSRLAWYGHLLTWDEVRAKQLELGIDDECMFVDSGKWAEIVYQQCCRFRWAATKGEPAPFGFLKKVGDRTIRLPVTESDSLFTPSQLPMDAVVTACGLYRVSEELTAQRLHLFRSGRAKGWTVPKNPPQEWTEQMKARVRRPRQHKLTGQTIWEWVTVGKCGEHAWDCERYQLVPAFIGGFLEPEVAPPPKTKEPE